MPSFTKHCSNFLRLAVAVATGVAGLAASAGSAFADAHPTAPMSTPMGMPMADAHVKRDPQLFAALVRAGGGAGAFSSARFLAAVTAGEPSEMGRLRARFGPATMDAFARVFDFAVARATPRAGALPPPAIPARRLASALYRTGLDRGSFQIEHLFDRLFGPSTHDEIMGAVAVRFGAAGESVYHAVLTQLLTDLGPSATPTRYAKMSAVPRATAMSAMPGMPAMPGMSTMPGMMMPSTPGPTVKSPAASSSSAMPAMPGMAPMPGMSAMPGTSASASAMKSNANGVQSMYGAGAMTGMADTMEMRRMPAVTDVGVPMSREASGTAWLPDSTTTFGHMSTHGDDMFMTHGAGFVRYSDTSGDRGSRTLNAPNWFMAMGSHPLDANSQLGARVMLSADFLTVGGFGYPLLFQTGETFAGRALHDHQHPHDLVSELAVTYSHQTSPGSSVSLYLGYPGEPALGPPTYMHREIAYDMADSPIGHHWEDSSHITFGVATAGFTTGRVKVEGSAFTGREPNEVRTNFDPVRMDSYSGRLSWNPNANVSTQVSYGYLKSPEALTPATDRRRITASIVTNNPLDFGQFFTTSAVWGQNIDSDGSPRSNAYLFEADYHRAFGSVYTRAEFVQKSGQELALDENPVAVLANPGAIGIAYPIGAYSLGFVRDVALPHAGTVAGLGAQVTFDTRPGGLAAFYGSQRPYGVEIFARFRPKAIR